jgi:PAS domain S-box-containing protein
MYRSERPARVLNVDDNAAGLYAKSRILRRAGFEVIEAQSGEDALRLAAETAPSLVLLDVQLPDISGIEVCRRIKDTPGNERLPVLHISATYGVDDAERVSAESGADIFLVEPIEPEELITVVRTLLRLRTTEIGLAERESRLRLAVEQAEIGTWDIDWRTGTAVYSQRLLEMLGHRADGRAATWQLWRARIHPEDRSRVEAAVEQAREAHQLLQCEFRVTRADTNEVRWLAMRGNVQPDAYRPGDRLLGVAIDITARKQLDARRESLLEREYMARTQAEEAARVKDQFLATLSHELRTPLSAVLGWMQLLRGGRLDPAQSRKALETIEHNARLQQQLINDMLDVSRIVTGQLRLDLVSVGVRGVLEASVASVRPQADEKDIALSVALPDDTTVRADAARLQQVFTNLLGNAIKFSPCGSRVELDAQVASGRLQVRVRDEGAGIAPESVPYIFDVFRQADGSITRQHGGLGLGLAIARHILDQHGGSIRAASAGPGRGATFTVDLPLAASPAPEPPQLPHAFPRAAPQTLAGACVLVVEDDPDSRALLCEMLALEGAAAHAAANADEAMALFRAQPAIDVVLSDIGMPGRDGYELIATLRRDFPERMEKVTALAVSGYARSEDRERSLLAGYHAHIAKPFEVVTLSSTIARLRGRIGVQAGRA